MIEIRDTPEGAVVAVRVIPRARRSALEGVRGGALLVRIVAAPVDDAANDAVIDLLSRALDLPRRSVRIVSGERARAKQILVEGIAALALRARLKAIL